MLKVAVIGRWGWWLVDWSVSHDHFIIALFSLPVSFMGGGGWFVVDISSIVSPENGHLWHFRK